MDTMLPPGSSELCDADSLLRLVDTSHLNLILVRHGQAGGNGLRDNLEGPALSLIGEQQAAHLAQRMASLPLDHIYASDMARSHQTAEAVAAFHPDTPLSVMTDIREVSGFQLRGRPQARKRDEFHRLHEERARVARFAEYLRKVHKPGQLIAIIAHNGINGMLLAKLTGIPYRRNVFFFSCHTGVAFANVSPDSHVVALRLLGCTRHLPADLVTDCNILHE